MVTSFDESQNYFKLFVNSRSSINPENLVKIGLIWMLRLLV